ncbi:RimK family alpha-L-glutamate ligase [Fibrella sp. WM1]|uniref:ATP-grasp domain-containing protein n=1 Tax=Fibrella musci TaxID=3242485 RepID=UPI00351FBED0
MSVSIPISFGLSQGGKAQKVYLSKNEKKICVNAAKALGLEFAGVDLMRERGKPYGKTESCYVTEVNGNPGTGIIDVTQHNHFLDLVEHVAKRKANKAKLKPQDSDSGSNAGALSSYPADMIHTGMNPQQAVEAFAGLILNDATPEKVMSLEDVGYFQLFAKNGNWRLPKC